MAEYVAMDIGEVVVLEGGPIDGDVMPSPDGAMLAIPGVQWPGFYWHYYEPTAVKDDCGRVVWKYSGCEVA